MSPSTNTPRGTDDAKGVGAATVEVLLVQPLLERDEAAFEALIERYHGPLARLALVFVRDPAVAEEVVQDTWVGVLNGLRSFEGRSSLKTWIFSLLTHKAKTRGARERSSTTRNIPTYSSEWKRDLERGAP